MATPAELLTALKQWNTKISKQVEQIVDGFINLRGLYEKREAQIDKMREKLVDKMRPLEMSEPPPEWTALYDALSALSFDVPSEIGDAYAALEPITIDDYSELESVIKKTPKTIKVEVSYEGEDGEDVTEYEKVSLN